MTAALSTAAVTLIAAAETETHIEVSPPPLVWGIVTFSLFMLLLAITLAFGRGRT